MDLYHVNAFTGKRFGGNPAGVCLLENDIPDREKLRIAADLDYSETAFVLFLEDKISLRWFTPETEVDLCGHASLSAAHILFEKGLFPPDDILRFSTRSGLLTARRVKDMIELNFPQKTVAALEKDPALNRALGIDPLFTGKSKELYFLEISNPDQLRTLQPDFKKLQGIAPGEFIVTCRSDDPDFDFLSRFFGPAVGIPEDPVTGSAHCYLAPYWSQILGKTMMTGYQASSRGGVVECELSENGRVRLRGHAATFSMTSSSI